MNIYNTGSSKKTPGGSSRSRIRGSSRIETLTPRRGLFQVGIEPEDLKSIYPHNVSFYERVPTESVSLSDFEDMAVARLKLLRTIERINLTSTTKYSKDWKTAITQELKKQNLEYFWKLGKSSIDHKSDGVLDKTDDEDSIMEARRFDHLSHYILRLAFCRTEDLRKWLISMELDYFRYKLMDFSRSKFMEFLKDTGLEYVPMDKDRQKEMIEDLNAGCFIISRHSADGIDFYEVPFTHVLDLVRGRKVFLKDGIAYVPYNELTSILASIFRINISEKLAVTNKLMPLIEEDERLSQLLTDFDKRHTGNSYASKTGKTEGVTAAQLPDLSKTSFPLCMKSLHDVVTKDFHLKHFGRLQLGLFFKAIGLPMDEATRFWRFNFTKKAGMDGGKFDKQYLYNIRHMYGQEGKRADYTPYSCMKIIMGAVGPGEHHGCPFRHSDATPLRVKLVEAKIPSNGIKEIMDLVAGHHYQIACQKYFEWTHSNATVEGGVNHPNQYFEESQDILHGVIKKSKQTKVKTTTSSIYPTKSKASMEDDPDYVLSQLDEEEILTRSQSQSIETSQSISEPQSEDVADVEMSSSGD